MKHGVDDEHGLMKEILDEYYGDSRDDSFKNEIVEFLLSMGDKIAITYCCIHPVHGLQLTGDEEA